MQRFLARYLTPPLPPLPSLSHSWLPGRLPPRRRLHLPQVPAPTMPLTGSPGSLSSCSRLWGAAATWAPKVQPTRSWAEARPWPHPLAAPSEASCLARGRSPLRLQGKGARAGVGPPRRRWLRLLWLLRLRHPEASMTRRRRTTCITTTSHPWYWPVSASIQTISTFPATLASGQVVRLARNGIGG